jgi:hypothetical protein
MEASEGVGEHWRASWVGRWHIPHWIEPTRSMSIIVMSIPVRITTETRCRRVRQITTIAPMHIAKFSIISSSGNNTQAHRHRQDGCVNNWRKLLGHHAVIHYLSHSQIVLN